MTDMQKGVEHCVVIGGGSWGTAIADALQKAGQHVSLLVRSEDTVALLAQGRCRQLPDLAANAPFAASTDATILRSASMVFVVVPVSATLDALEQFALSCQRVFRLCCAQKGWSPLLTGRPC